MGRRLGLQLERALARGMWQHQPPRMQVKLLSLDGEPYYRLGGTRKISVDSRVIAATNADLEKALKEGSFRRDLYHSVAQVEIKVPPLRERTADIAPLQMSAR